MIMPYAEILCSECEIPVIYFPREFQFAYHEMHKGMMLCDVCRRRYEQFKAEFKPKKLTAQDVESLNDIFTILTLDGMVTKMYDCIRKIAETKSLSHVHAVLEEVNNKKKELNSQVKKKEKQLDEKMKIKTVFVEVKEK